MEWAGHLTCSLFIDCLLGAEVCAELCRRDKELRPGPCCSI